MKSDKRERSGLKGIFGRIKILIFILLVLSLALYFLADRLVDRQEARMATLEDSASALKESWSPLRFMIKERGEEEFTLRIKLYSLDDEVVGQDEWTLQGEELFVDFMTLPVAENLYISFPRALFTDAIPPVRGEVLYSLYDDHGFPAIFSGGSLTEELKTPLTNLFSTLQEEDISVEKSFGNVIHDVKQIRSFRTGYVYRAVCRRKGGIEIIEE